ncbi:hypothetical protein K439DRAFT_1647801 [Ramaria rubella]|nr:hypothetical protein K439DRAFT_1647801 [Ramaria rubella]
MEPVTYATTVLTKELGAIPSYNTLFYCRNCHTRYHHNYCIHSAATLRMYYPGVPWIVQASQKFFIEASMYEIFTTMMNCSWTSVTNCARIYNQAFAPLAIKEILPSEWQPMPTCYYDDVWDAFFTYSLLLDSHTRAEVLELPHRPLEAQNERMMGIRMEQWNHTCNKCMRVFDGANGQKRAIRLVVTDGIALGHPCCAGELECKNLLPNNHTVYCTEHQYKVGQCAVTTCSNPVTPGCKTYYYKLMGKTMFQLKLQLERNKVGQPHASNKGAGLDDEELLVTGTGEVESVPPGGLLGSVVASEASPSCPSKPPTGNRSVRAWFGRKRTHNKELCVGSCEMILGQVTFYRLEGPNDVHWFWKGLFPTRASLPQVLWMDMNCINSAMLHAQGDTYFQNCALPVDVFHYKCKHKKTDTWCTQNCNPTHWPELMHYGSWGIQGGFLSIVREMHVDRYNFFLDEMIWRCNNMIYMDLRAKGRSPYLIPWELLRGD